MGGWRAARLVALLLAVTGLAVAAAIVVADQRQPTCADCASVGHGGFGTVASASSTPLPNSAGDWTGLFIQSNGESYAIRVELGPDFTPAKVSYPELRCEGSWTVQGFDGTSWTLVEHVAKGPCTRDGVVHLRWASDGDLVVDYRATVDNYTARAVLSRGSH